MLFRKTIKQNKDNVFTDREEVISIFENAYENVKKRKDSSSSVVSIYGLSGTGKTSLCDELKLKLEQNHSSSIVVSHDFRVMTDKIIVLELLKNKFVISAKLKAKRKCAFTLYNYALKKMKTSEVYAKYNAQQKDKDVDFIELMASVVTKLIGMELIYDVANLSLKLSKKLMRFLGDKHECRQLSSYLKIIDNTPVDEVEKMLQLFFAMDVSRNLGDVIEPMVIFLDSYEKISNVALMDSNVDDWLVSEDGLIKNIPNTLWVILGTESFVWENSNDMVELVEAPELTGFERKFSIQYLEKVGIFDNNIQEDFIMISKGIPVLLSLLAKEYKLKKENGKELRYKDMECKADRWIKSLLKNFNQTEKEYIYVFGTLSWWSDEIIPEVYPNYNYNRYDNCLNKLINYKIIECDDKFYYFKKSFSDLMKNFHDENYIKVKSNTVVRAIDYYKRRVNKMKPSERLYSEYLFEIIRQFTNLNISQSEFAKEYFGFVSKKIRKLIEYAKINEVVRFFEFMNGKVTDFLEENTELASLILIDYAMMKKYRGDFSEAIKCVSRALEFLCSKYDDGNEYVMSAKQELSSALYFKGDFEESIKIDCELQKKKIESYGEHNISTLWTNFFIATTCNRLERCAEAENILKSVLENLEKYYPNDDTGLKNRVLHHLAIVYESNGNEDDMNRALEVKRELLQTRKMSLGSSHPYTLKVQYSIVRSYIALGQYEDAIKLSKKTIKAQEFILGFKHPDTLKTKRLLGCSMREGGDIEGALAIIGEVEEAFSETLGISARETLNTTYEKVITMLRSTDERCMQAQKFAVNAVQCARKNKFGNEDELVRKLEKICGEFV